MALQIWLPLTKDLKNYGLRQDLTFSTISDTGAISMSSEGKIGPCYERTKTATKDCIRSSSTILLDNSFSMCCWALISAPGNSGSANGIITNHSHAVNAGAGITMRYISANDYRISCNTGTGSDRTYFTYAGNTNIYNKWHHLGLTYNKSTQTLRLYVDGLPETISSYNSSGVATAIGKDLHYNMAATHTYFDLFNWSTTHQTSADYRPKCKLNDVRVYDHCLSAREMKIISQGLILNYKLDTSFNSAIEYDCSGYNQNGVRHGNFTSSTNTARHLNACMFTDGRSNYITSPTMNAPKENITISCWVKGTEAGYNNYHIPLCFNSSEYEVSITSNGKLRGGFVIPNSAIAPDRKCDNTSHTANLFDDKWHMLTLTYNGHSIMRYVDGIEARVSDEAKYKICPGTMTGNAGQWYIGNYCNSGGYGNKNLAMSDVRIYVTALSAADVQELYQTSISLTKDGTLFGSELYEADDAISSFGKSGIIKADTIRDCKEDNSAATKLQVFADTVQSTNFIEW